MEDPTKEQSLKNLVHELVAERFLTLPNNDIDYELLISIIEKHYAYYNLAKVKSELSELPRKPVSELPRKPVREIIRDTQAPWRVGQS